MTRSGMVEGHCPATAVAADPSTALRAVPLPKTSLGRKW